MTSIGDMMGALAKEMAREAFLLEVKAGEALEMHSSDGYRIAGGRLVEAARYYNLAAQYQRMADPDRACLGCGYLPPDDHEWVFGECVPNAHDVVRRPL